jgi:(4S)-4-hydroxy-5-phosphonooxypentane-2,3-dione isomerase
MVCLAVTYLVLPNREGEAKELFGKLTQATRREPGCRLYQAHQSLSEPRRFFLYEQYDDEAAVKAHRESPHFEEYVQRGLFRIMESRTPELYAPLPD